MSYLEGKLPAVVVHAAAVHETEGVADGLRVQDGLAGDGAHAAVGQCAGDHGRRLAGHLHRAHLTAEQTGGLRAARGVQKRGEGRGRLGKWRDLQNVGVTVMAAENTP